MVRNFVLLFLILSFYLMIMVIFSVPPILAYFVSLVFVIVVTLIIHFRSRKTGNIRIIQLNRKISATEELRGRIVHETDHNYLVSFSTWSDGRWEEVVPKHSEEIVEIYNETLVPLQPTIHGI